MVDSETIATVTDPRELSPLPVEGAPSLLKTEVLHATILRRTAERTARILLVERNITSVPVPQNHVSRVRVVDGSLM
jgi:hypothetical protein